ncbi:MAG: ribonuclease III [Candidatus Liberibacter ctenarytainae]|uniref:Ribonuclease 3 n=1 Tax=Candidatus Liberibacter ctenarytainae TaxID=2020335 RepID=A0A937DHH5_9HYPH|nr:ribonuclease III [Candidatus Liberibacter ctenarytainae]
MSSSQYSDLEKQIGYSFSDKNLLEKALTHSSVSRTPHENYERLEFLGDRILGLLVAELLLEYFDTAREGELSIRFNSLVSAETCCQVAKDLNLYSFVHVSYDLKKDMNMNRWAAGIQADVVESLIAALYLDGGLEHARSFVEKYWMSRAVENEKFRRDAKTELQEWAHAQFGLTPEYRMTSRSGPDHNPRFTVMVEIASIVPGIGTDYSKRAAEQVAATEVLKREGIWK